MEATQAALVLSAPENRTDIHDIRPLVEAPFSWAWLWWCLLAAGILSLFYWGFLYWKKQPKKQPKQPAVRPEPPHERARRLLENALAHLHNPERFCVMVSDAIRRYLEERFRFRAPERTTEEFLKELQESRYLSRDQKRLLADFLAECDLAKFAKSEPEAYELKKLHGFALRLVQETEPALMESPTDAGTTATAPPKEPAVISTSADN